MSRPPIESSMSPRFRPTRAKESTATEGRPACPRYLSRAAKQRFRQIARELESRRALTKGDGELLVLYSVTWERWRTAMDHVIAEGEIVESISKDKYGEPITRQKKNPWLVVAQESEKNMTAYLDRLGFTPINRERCKPVQKEKPKEPELDEIDVLLGNKDKENDTWTFPPVQPGVGEVQ